MKTFKQFMEDDDLDSMLDSHDDHAFVNVVFWDMGMLDRNDEERPYLGTARLKMYIIDQRELPDSVRGLSDQQMRKLYIALEDPHSHRSYGEFDDIKYKTKTVSFAAEDDTVISVIPAGTQKNIKDDVLCINVDEIY